MYVELRSEPTTPQLLNGAFLQEPHILNVDNMLYLPCLVYGALVIERHFLKHKYTTQKHKMTTVTPAHACRGLNIDIYCHNYMQYPLSTPL